MRDFITDALRSSIPVNGSTRFLPRRMILPRTSTLPLRADGRLRLHPRVDAHHQNRVADRGRELHERHQRRSAQARRRRRLAEADRIKRVTEATAEAEAMAAGEGIANQRKAIALGIKDSLEIIQETGVGVRRGQPAVHVYAVGRDDIVVCRQKLDGRAAEQLFAVGLDVRADAGGRQGSKRFEGVDARENIPLFASASSKSAFWKDACAEYTKRLGAYAKVDMREVADIDPAKAGGVDAARDKEGVAILAALPPRAHVILLAIEGKERSSEELSARLIDLMLRGNSDIAGNRRSDGVSDAVRARADEMLSFDALPYRTTWRAWCCWSASGPRLQDGRGEPYHNRSAIRNNGVGE